MTPNLHAIVERIVRAACEGRGVALRAAEVELLVDDSSGFSSEVADVLATRGGRQTCPGRGMFACLGCAATVVEVPG
jgi:hypothetical protein